LGLYCVNFGGGNTSCTCTSNTEYWDTTNFICTPKKDYGSACTYNAQCKDFAEQHCISNICQCADSRWYSYQASDAIYIAASRTAYDACLPRGSHDRECAQETATSALLFDKKRQCLQVKANLVTTSDRELTCQPTKSGSATTVSYTCQCENYYAAIRSDYYWSSLELQCKACPANYYSGYPLQTSTQNAYNTITSKCYFVETNIANVKTYAAATTFCTGTSKSLMRIFTTYEMAVASSFVTPSNTAYNYWVGSGPSTAAKTFTWAGVAPAVSVLDNLYCPTYPIQTVAGFALLIKESYTFDIAAPLNYYACLQDIVTTQTSLYICEYAEA
jgi:hypothetical protein